MGSSVTPRKPGEDETESEEWKNLPKYFLTHGGSYYPGSFPAEKKNYVKELL